MLWAVLSLGLAGELDANSLVRVEGAGHPEAIVSSMTGSLLVGPPTDGTPWQPETLAEIDERSVAQETLEAVNAHHWHAAGFRGQGVKIAVFDPAWYGLESVFDEVGPAISHDCFASRMCDIPIDSWAPRLSTSFGVHGIACAEIVRDVAPGAELYLVNVAGITTLENGIAWAIKNDIDVISMSMSFYSDDFYDGSGPTSSLMPILAANDILMVTSSGNTASSHWRGAFVDGDGDGRMDFEGDNALQVYLQGDISNTVNVIWDQYTRCGDTDLGARVVNEVGDIIAVADVEQRVDGQRRCSPVERLRASPPETGWYQLEVLVNHGSTAYLQVDVHNRAGSVSPSRPQGSVTNPASHPDAMAVGAVRARNYWTNSVESFSSWGPSGAGHVKPDIVGPDGLTTDVYGTRGFFGTSASTPAVAGMIALVMSREPELTPLEAAQRLEDWALKDTATFEQPDPRWGAGKARLPILDNESSCGRRPLLMPLFLLPPWWFRRRQREQLA